MKTKLMLIVLTLTIFAGVSYAQKAPAQEIDLKEYTGRYLFTYDDRTEDVIVELRNDSLVATASLGKANLKFIAEDNFGIPQYGGLVEFVRDETTLKITGVKVIIPMGDIDLEGIRDEKETVVVQK